MENIEKEIIQAIKEDRLYDFIANHYWEIKPEMLKDLILEIYYILRYETDVDLGANMQETREKIIESLKQNRDWEEE